MIYPLNVNIFHPEVDNHGSGDGEGVAGKKIQLLFLSVFENVEIFC